MAVWPLPPKERFAGGAAVAARPDPPELGPAAAAATRSCRKGCCCSTAAAAPTISAAGRSTGGGGGGAAAIAGATARGYSSFTESSDQDGNSAVVSLNGTQLVMNNKARSRAPLPGFSSFV